MEFNDYQQQAVRTRPEGLTHQERVFNYATGIGGESGEILELLKKHFFHGEDMDRDKLVKELGDLSWYMALLSDEFGIEYDEVPIMNINKLRRRYPNGFTVQDSLNRSF